MPNADIASKTEMICEIENNIRLNCRKIYIECRSKIEFHNKLQNHMYNLACLYGCHAVKEYKYSCNENRRNGRIDVIWKKNNKIICAFEIDSCYRLKSINKLKKIEAENKIWIIYFKNKYHKYDLKILQKEIKIIMITCLGK